MMSRELLSAQIRAALFDPPADAPQIVRHYTFSVEDRALIQQRRRHANRLGFAAHLAVFRCPERPHRRGEPPRQRPSREAYNGKSPGSD
jgi:hypothetical protein